MTILKRRRCDPTETRLDGFRERECPRHAHRAEHPRTFDPDSAIKRIASPGNAQVKANRSLHQKKSRAAEGLR